MLLSEFQDSLVEGSLINTVLYIHRVTIMPCLNHEAIIKKVDKKSAG